MHILIATAGVLPPTPVAALSDKLLDETGAITVMTVIEVPRTFLDSMDDDQRRSFLDDDRWKDESAEQKALAYLEERGRRMVEPVLSALRAHGRSPELRYVEGGDPAEAIIATADEVGADLIMMGATRRLFTEQAWTSVSARVMERTQCPLVLVPGAKSDDSGEIPRVEP